MKTRNKFPFIYFLFDPNIVFVYKIETQNYLTVTELSRSGVWETFELNNAEEFKIFNHEEWKPLEGRGYFVSLEDENLMVEKINQLIHQQRSSKNQGELTAPVHIVTSQSIAGALRFGLERPKNVIGFDGFFSIGPVWQLDSKMGQNNRNEWLADNINFGPDDYEYENRFSNTLLEIEDIPGEVPIYIWAANNGDEQTGIRFILQLLKDKANEVFLINTTEHYAKWMTSKEEKRTIFHTVELHPEQLKLVFEKSKAAKPLTSKERIQFQQEWELLAQTMGVLRLWQNGRIAEVPEHYFDSYILRTIERIHSEQDDHDFIKAARVIGEVLGQMDETVSDAFLEYRIRHLIYSGVLALKGIPKSMRHYRVKLR